LETTKDHHHILEIQGAIAELKRFETLRDEVIEGSK
jgi:glutaredoxin-related protein